MHPEAVARLQCDQCGRLCASQVMLSVHKRKGHVPESERPVGCDQCERRFICKSDLKEHLIQAHIKNRPYPCRFGCGATYRIMNLEAAVAMRRSMALP